MYFLELLNQRKTGTSEYSLNQINILFDQSPCFGIHLFILVTEDLKAVQEMSWVDSKLNPIFFLREYPIFFSSSIQQKL